MAPQDQASAQVDAEVINVDDSGSDSGPDAPTSPSGDHASTMAAASGAVKRSVENPDDEAGPATKRQKSSAGGVGGSGSGSGSGAFLTIKAKQEEKGRRKKLMAAQIETECNEWEQTNEGLSKTKKLNHKKEVTKRVGDEFMVRNEHPDQIVVDKSPAKSKAPSVVPAPQAPPAVATPKKSGIKAAKPLPLPAIPSKDRKKLPASKKPATSNKNVVPDSNDDGKVLIDGTADYVSNNLVEKAQSDALETIVKANEKATELRKRAEEQAAQIIAGAHAQLDEKVKSAGEEAAQIVEDAESHVAQILTKARQRAEEKLDKAKEESDAIDRDSHLRVVEVVDGARDRAVRADEEAAAALRDIDEATDEIRRGKTTLKNFFEGITARAAPRHENPVIKATKANEEAVARQVLGPLFDSPTVATLLTHPYWMTGEGHWTTVKRCLEENSIARHDFALLSRLMNGEHALQTRGHVDLPHHPMHPPARAASVPNYENKVFKLKKEEGEN